MTSSRRQSTSSLDKVLWTSSILAGATEIALVAILIGLLTKHTHPHDSYGGLSWAASIAHLLALMLLPLQVFLLLQSRTQKIGSVFRTAFAGTFVLITLLACVLSIYVLVRLWSYMHGLKPAAEDRNAVVRLCQAGFGMWTGTVLAHALVFIALLTSSMSSTSTTSPHQGDQDGRPSPVRSLKNAISIQLHAVSPPPAIRFENDHAADTRTHHTHGAIQSQPSLSKMTSKTKLLLQKARDSYSLHSERKSSLDTNGQEDDFGDWSTTSPQDVHPASRRPLETIPGSRPVSSTNVLDGPFPDEEQHQFTSDDYQVPRRRMLHEQASPASDTNSVRYSTRSVQSTTEQANIHPLFRSESPIPAPSISAGTTVYGSPIGGQRVTAENEIFLPRKLSSAHSNRAESPNPFSPAISRQASLQSVRVQSPLHFEQSNLQRPAPAFAALPEG